MNNSYIYTTTTIKPTSGFFTIQSLLLICTITFIYGCQVEEATHEATTVEWIDKLDNHRDWGIYRGDKRGNQYSELDQINAGNVHLLEVAWEYQYAGEAERPGIYSNPIIIDGLLYFNTPRMNTVALDAATGEEVWVFDPTPLNDGQIIRSRSRGVIYWEDENGNNQRILNSVRDRVYAIDAKTGEHIADFGQQRQGYIDLRQDLAVDPEFADIEITTQGVVYKNFLIVSGRQPEGNSSTPGGIRAYNTLTGDFEWIFNTIPLPGEFGYDTWEWEEGMIYGAANAWGGLSVDNKRGWVFAATGSAAGEFIYGGSRKGDNLFSNTLLALDATTGERKWHYQVICHDIWDYDVPAAPNLATITTDEGQRDVVIQMGKQPQMFILDRDTGEPIFPVVQKPVPSFQGVEGERPCETQPWPLKPEPLVRTSMYESDITRITPESYAFVLEQFKQHRTGPVFTPASLEGTITVPGHHGSVQWPGGTFDPATNILYVAVNEEPTVHRLIPLEPDNMSELMQTATQRGRNIYMTNCTVCHGFNREGSLPLYPPLTDLELSTDELRTVLVQGYGEMPSFSNMSDDQINDVIKYLESDGEETAQNGNYDPEDGVPTWSGSGSGGSWTTTTPQYSNHAHHFVDHMGYPAINPPWGQIIAVDIAEGEILWKRPLGEYPELVAMGIRNTGTEVFAGPVSTAGGIIFAAGTPDEKIRVFDKNNGEILWEYKLPYGGYAIPSVYEINGKQYVVIAAGGAGKIATQVGKSVIAFTLPD